MMHQHDGTTKVAIVGGGCAAMAAAFELTRPELEGRYSVSVYQMGWRLGGKGASGRGEHERIQEHGLHLWMGYYENAFRLMRECFAELNAHDAGGARWTFEDAFSPAHRNGAMDFSPQRGWVPWKVDFPAAPGLPGDSDAPKLGVTDYLAHAARLLRTLLSTLPVEASAAAPAPLTAAARNPTEQELAAALTQLLKFGALAGLGAVLEALSWLEAALEALTGYSQSLVARLVDVTADLARVAVERLVTSDDQARRLWEVAELILAAIRGSIRFRLAFDPRGFDAIDDYDCREWLKMNGASERAIDSAFIRALYDLAFAYVGGDPERPAIAAGSALRGAFRAFFTYRGAFFWRMNAGMGDAVFAPFYQVLRRRGVRFEFFHKLTGVGLAPPSAASPHVTSLDFDVQAVTRSRGEYQPLRIVKGLPCWPAEPLFDQLESAHELSVSNVDFEAQADRRCVAEKTLRVGADFDFVVLAVGLGVVPAVCGSLVERDPRWRQMVERVRSVPTQAFQVWLNRDIAALGGDARAINLSGFTEPFDTVADMTHVVARENWPVPPRALAYFCNVLSEDADRDALDDSPEFVAAAYERVRSQCVQFLSTDVRHLWPLAYSVRGEFDWRALASVTSGEGAAFELDGAERFATQFWTANVRLSDRYTQALPGSTKFRISPLDRAYDNLTVAGDWTNCGLNMGCVEAAVMSGRLAAYALSGSPKLSAIVGYDHP